MRMIGTTTSKGLRASTLKCNGVVLGEFIDRLNKEIKVRHEYDRIMKRGGLVLKDVYHHHRMENGEDKEKLPKPLIF